MTLLDGNSGSSSAEDLSSFSDEQFADSSSASSSGVPDDLANTPQPPPELRNEQTRQRYEFYRENARRARKFYEADKTFDQEDRVTLLKAFRVQMYSQYVGSFAGLVLGIALPKFVCKAIGRTYKPSYSTLTAFATIIPSYWIAERASYNYNINRFQGNRRYIEVFESTNGFPPVLGYSYYQETVRRPDSSFPDPSKFDWNRYPSFPLVLTTWSWYKKDIKGITESSAPTPYRRPGSTATTVPHTDYGDDASGESTTVNASGFDLPTDTQTEDANKAPSTWDLIRSQNTAKTFQWEPQHQQHSHNNTPYQGTSTPPPSSQDPLGSAGSDNSQDFFDDPYAEKSTDDKFK